MNNIETLNPNSAVSFSHEEEGLQKYAKFIPSGEFQKIYLICQDGTKSITASNFKAMANLLEKSNFSTQAVLQNDTWVVTEPENEQEFDDLKVLDLYVKPQPTKKFKVKGIVKSIKKGEIKFFSDEFETL